MAISASTLYDFVQCPHRVYMDLNENIANRDEVSPFVRLLWERGTTYEKEVIGRLDQPFLDLSDVPSDQKEALTREAMRRGEPLIYSGRISADDLIGIPDLLRKDGDGYVPGDIKAGSGEEGGSDDEDGKPKLHYAVQLALYVDILDRLGLSAGHHGFIWDIHGQEVRYDLDAAQGPRKPESLWHEYQTALANVRAIVAGDAIPGAAYSSSCKQCYWYSACVGALVAADDLTLIPALGRSLRNSLQPTFSTVAALAGANPDGFIKGKKTDFPGLGPDRLRTFQARASLLKSDDPQPYLKAAVQFPVTPVELFFDIEVDPMRDHCYLHGIVERTNHDARTEQFTAFFAEEVSPDAERAAFASALQFFDQRPNAAVYYYSKYERTWYRNLQRRYPDVCSEEDIEALFRPPRAIDLYFDVVVRATEWPTRDHSIKTLAKFLGFDWRDTHPSGAASIEWFDRWCREREASVRQRILDYNEDDCRATRVLLDGIRSLTVR